MRATEEYRYKCEDCGSVAVRKRNGKHRPKNAKRKSGIRDSYRWYSHGWFHCENCGCKSTTVYDKKVGTSINVKRLGKW